MTGVARGVFITFEGGDGSGKTSQLVRLDTALRQRGFRTVTTREPGGSDFGREVRQIVLHSRDEITPKAEALLYAADRAHHIATVVRPALERGDVVLQDRYLDSSVAYQGVGRVLDPDEVRALSLWAADGLLPDVTILLDVDESTARARLDGADKPFDRLESEHSDFHARVRRAFLDLAQRESDRFVVVDASRDPDAVAVDVLAAALAALSDRDGTVTA